MLPLFVPSTMNQFFFDTTIFYSTLKCYLLQRRLLDSWAGPTRMEAMQTAEVPQQVELNLSYATSCKKVYQRYKAYG